MTISQRKRLLIDIALSAKSAENPSATGLDQGSPSAGERAAPLRSIMPPSKKGPSMEPGPSEREGDDDDGESTASRRRYHDALSTGVGMDARVHGTSTRTAPPGFPSQRGSARGPTPPSSQVGGSSPPRMFAAPGQPVGSSFNLDNVNLGGAHRSQTQTTASASNPKPTRSSFERPASLQGRSSAASDRWKAAGRATGVPDNAQEPGTKKRSGFMLAYKAVKRSMGIPSKKEKAANEKDAAKPRGAAAFASVLPPRTAPAGGANASNAKNDPHSTPGTKRSAKDLWATAGAASGVTDEAIASASKKKSPLLMAYKKMKRSMGIPSKKERTEREALTNFPATPKTLPELASMDPMGGDSPGGETGSGGETRYQSALAQIIGQPVTTNTQQRPTETRTMQPPATRHLPSRTMSMAEHSPQRMVGRAWDPELVDRILGGDVEGAIVSGQTRARHGHGRSDSNTNVEALLAMADEISVEVSDAGALSARERWALAGRGTGASDAAARVRDASTGDAFYKTVESASVRRKFADAMRETIGDMRRRHESTVAIAFGMSALIEELEDVEPAAVAFGRLQLRTGFVGESYRPASRREPYVVARAPDLEANRQSQNRQNQSQRSSMSLGPGVHPPTPLDIGVLPDPPGMDEHWHMSPAKAEMESSSAAVDAAVNAALSLFPPSPEKSIDSIEPSPLNTSIDDAPLLPIPAEIEEEMETRTRTRTQTRPRTPPPRHRFTDEERRRISSTAKGRENLPPGIKNRLDAMTRRTAAEVKAAAIVDEDDELSDDVRNDRARNNTVGHASDTSSGSDEVNVGGWLDRPERFARGRDLKTSNSRPTSAVGGLSASQSPAAIAAMRARNAAAAARRRLPGLATRGSNRAVGLEAKFREAASDSDGFDSPNEGSDVESDGGGSSSSSPVAALRARGLAPKASSDLESLRALRRKLAESSSGKNKTGVGAAKVLGDLARLGGYNSWDQVPTKRDPHGRNDGDLDALLMSPASEADVIRARDALDATPKSVSEARLRAAYAVDVQRRRVRMSSPRLDVDRDGSVPVSPYAYGKSPDGSPAHRSLAQRRAAYREARARAIQEAGLDGS